MRSMQEVRFAALRNVQLLHVRLRGHAPAVDGAPHMSGVVTGHDTQQTAVAVLALSWGVA